MTPPIYNLTQYNVPTYLYTGGKDWLADPEDVKGLISSINRPGVLMNVTTISYYEHLDFIWGEDAGVKIYDAIIKEIMKSH